MPASVPVPSARGRRRLSQFFSGLDLRLLDSPRSGTLRRSIADAMAAAFRAFSELEDLDPAGALAPPSGGTDGERSTTTCPQSIVLSAEEFRKRVPLVELPRGLTLGSHITVAATPRPEHAERDPTMTILREGDRPIMESQLMMELQGLKTVDGEDPPRILHFNPCLRGDWSARPVIEQNTCYRMQWGSAQRCEGWRSRAHEETVDGLMKCETWIQGNEEPPEDSKTTWWLNPLIRQKEVNLNWPYLLSRAGYLFLLSTLAWTVTM